MFQMRSSGRTTCKRVRTRVPRWGAGPAAALVALVSAAAPTLANDTVSAGVGGTSITVNGTTISTSEIDLEELGALQGVPASTVKLELEAVAAETPERTAVDAIVSRLAADTPLATALANLSTASGGAISPARALTSVVAQNGHPGASGSTGAPGQPGAGAGTGQPSTTTAHNSFRLRPAARRLEGRRGSHVRVRFSVSSAATLIYTGRHLATGVRKINAGTNLLVVKLPRTPGNYRLTLKAIGAREGQTAQNTITLVALRSKASHKHHH